MDTKQRCGWVGDDPLYIRYHDEEWGRPVHDDRTHFEFLILEGAQAGLSWSTVLRKREGYRKAFDGFDPARVARFTPARIRALLQDPGIIRNRAKVASAVENAGLFLEVQREHGSFDALAWSFVGGKPIRRRPRTLKDIAATTAESDAFSKALKARGFRFVGPTIIYAHMQACGLVDDHVQGCFLAKRKGPLPARPRP
jgi:DNA-3-methyladenine glycosylase I